MFDTDRSAPDVGADPADRVSAEARARTEPLLALAEALASQAAPVEAGFALVAGFEPRSAPVASAADEVAEDAALEAVLVAVQERLNALHGLQAATMAQLARRELAPGAPSRVRPLGAVDPVAVAGIDLALGAGSVSAGRRVAQAARLVRDFPRTTGAMVAGRVDQTRVDRLLRATQEAPSEVCRVIDASLADRLPDLDPSRVASTVRRSVERVAPEVARRAARAARDRSTVEVSPGPEGMTQWFALIPTVTSAAMWGAVTTLAAQHRADDRSLTQDRARAMALADLVLGRATIDASITLGMPVVRAGVATGGVVPGEMGMAEAAGQSFAERAPSGRCEPEVLSGDALHAWVERIEDDLERWGCWEPDEIDSVPDAPAEPPLDERDGGWCDPTPLPPGMDTGCASSVDLGRLGVIDAGAVTALLSRTDLRVGRALLDAETGALLETRTDAYRPSAAVRRFVTTRDETCRWFGCTRRAVSDPDSLGGGGRRRADIDHVVPWPHGETTPTNLLTLCRRHHRAKQAAGISIAMTPDGIAGMRSRTGVERTTRPPAQHEVPAPA